MLVGWLHTMKDSDPLLPAGGAEERRNDSGPVLVSVLPMQSGERKVLIYLGSRNISSPPNPHFGGIFEKHVLECLGFGQFRDRLPRFISLFII